MRITTTGNVLIDTTNEANGMLEQGGVCGQVMSYPLSGVMTATGMTREDIEEADPDDDCREGVTIREACAWALTGHMVRRGVVIE